MSKDTDLAQNNRSHSSPEIRKSTAKPLSPPSGGRLKITNQALGNVSLFFATLAFFSFIASTLIAHASNFRYPEALYVGMAGVCLLCVLGSSFAFRGNRTLSYAALLAAVCLAMINGAFIAGYGLFAPSLVVGVVPFSLAFAVFERRPAWIWASPIPVIWIVIFALHFSGMYAPDSTLIRPLPFNIAMNLIAAVVAVGYVNFELTGQAEQALVSEEAQKLRNAKELQYQQTLQGERERFMGQLSHEIRTPIAALRNAVTLMRNPKATEAMKLRSLSIVDNTSASLLALLDDAMDSFRYGSQQFRLNNSLLDLRLLLDEIEALFAPVAQQKGLVLGTDLSALTVTVVSGDGMRLRQMLSNLVGNALKFTDSGSILMRVLPPSQAGHMLWRFEVSDTGCGIPHERQAALFSPFTQVHDVQKSATVGGSGLGLSIVRQLAEAMGGSAGVTSVPGKGSTFWFEVRLVGAMPDLVESQTLRVSS